MTLNEVKKGDFLMLFDKSGKSFGGATNHTLTISPEYTEVMCKDCGETPWKKLSKVNWQITTENLYIAADFASMTSRADIPTTSVAELGLLEKAYYDKEFTIIFGESNWNSNGLEKGGDAGATLANWSPDTTHGGFVYYGKVKISSLTLNASSGDNATYSVTFDGVGNFTPYTSNTTITGD